MDQGLVLSQREVVGLSVANLDGVGLGLVLLLPDTLDMNAGGVFDLGRAWEKTPHRKDVAYKEGWEESVAVNGITQQKHFRANPPLYAGPGELVDAVSSPVGISDVDGVGDAVQLHLVSLPFGAVLPCLAVVDLNLRVSLKKLV